MSDLIKTLHKKGDNTVNVFPNIKSENIPDNAVTTAKINDNAIVTSKIANSSITNSKLAGSSVSSAKIESGAVTNSKLGAGSVTADKISSEAITTAKLFDRAVTTAKIENGAVTTDKLGNFSVTSAKIATGAVTNSEIANGAVDNDKIEDGSIQPTKLVDRLYTHAIKVHLKDTSANVTFFLGFNILSKSDSSLILLFSDLLDALKPFEQIAVWDVGNDKPGYISSVDFQGNGYISAYVDDNGTMTEYEFDEIVADSFDNDKITLLY